MNPTDDATRPASGRVHPAAEGFGGVAAVYERARPGFPAAAVTWLVDRIAPAPSDVVVDLAAGTGKFTLPLVTEIRARSEATHVVAVEPVAGMRARLRSAAPAVPVLAATAERLPLAEGSAAAVTVAQAFHWFETEPAMRGLARVIRPGGVLALVWNARDRSVGWIDRIWTAMDRIEHDAPWRDHRDGTARASGRPWTEDGLLDGGPWAAFDRADFVHVQALTPEGVVDRVHSVSHVAALPDPERAAVLDEVRTVLRDDPETAGKDLVELRYRTEVWITRRL